MLDFATTLSTRHLAHEAERNEMTSTREHSTIAGETTTSHSEIHKTRGQGTAVFPLARFLATHHHRAGKGVRSGSDGCGVFLRFYFSSFLFFYSVLAALRRRHAATRGYAARVCYARRWRRSFFFSPSFISLFRNGPVLPALSTASCPLCCGGGGGGCGGFMGWWDGRGYGRTDGTTASSSMLQVGGLAGECIGRWVG